MADDVNTFHTVPTLERDQSAFSATCECGWKSDPALDADGALRLWWEHSAKMYAELASYMRPIVDAAMDISDQTYWEDGDVEGGRLVEAIKTYREFYGE